MAYEANASHANDNSINSVSGQNSQDEFHKFKIAQRRQEDVEALAAPSSIGITSKRSPSNLETNDETTYRPEYSTGPPYDFWNIDEKYKCKVHGYAGDGTWDDNRSCWVHHRCRNKNCRRHWRRFARQKYKQVTRQMPQRKFWYHVRLSYKISLQSGHRFQNLNKFIRKIQTKYPDCWLASVIHRGRKDDHVHLLLGSNQEIQKLDVVNAWKSHWPGKKTATWTNSLVYFKQFFGPKRLIWYGVMGRNNKPRTSPPWLNVPCRSPVKVHKCRKPDGASVMPT